jgi:hypothetical protein
MRLNPSLPLSDSFQARLAAQAILRNQFDMKKAVAELNCGPTFGSGARLVGGSW